MVLFASLLRKNSNEERPESTEGWPPSSVNGKVGEVRRVKMKTEPSSPKTIDLRNVGTEDLMYIKKVDPFLYYSIPEVRSAKILGRDVDIKAQPPRTAKRSSMSAYPIIRHWRPRRVLPWSRGPAGVGTGAARPTILLRGVPS